MSRSYRNVYKETICEVSHKAMHDWKTMSKRLRRTRCKNVLRNIDVNSAEDDESFYPEKYQRDMKDTNDLSGPHYCFTKDFNPKKSEKAWKRCMK